MRAVRFPPLELHGGGEHGGEHGGGGGMSSGGAGGGGTEEGGRGACGFARGALPVPAEATFDAWERDAGGHVNGDRVVLRRVSLASNTCLTGSTALVWTQVCYYMYFQSIFQSMFSLYVSLY